MGGPVAVGKMTSKAQNLAQISDSPTRGIEAMQRAFLELDPTLVVLQLPEPEQEVLPGVPWGSVEAFPSPAYWAYQVLARRMLGASVQNRLGSTLREEVAACLLGGHGIPSEVGVAAFEHLRGSGVFAGAAPSEAEILRLLSAPLTIARRACHYRFAQQKSRHLAQVLERLDKEEPPAHSGRVLRDWLLGSGGFGLKTSSWVARNWLGANDVAILDIHIHRAGVMAGFFDSGSRIEKDYLAMEQQFLQFSRNLGVLPSELDAVIWREMKSAGPAVQRLLAQAAE